jgi:hypothetical protein
LRGVVNDGEEEVRRNDKRINVAKKIQNVREVVVNYICTYLHKTHNSISPYTNVTRLPSPSLLFLSLPLSLSTFNSV